MTTTGARVSEMCNLTIGDLMLDHELGPRALLRETKNGKPRVVGYAARWSAIRPSSASAPQPGSNTTQATSLGVTRS